ncbi:hypothetical protein Tco_0807589 [Tanacetum coccineum]
MFAVSVVKEVVVSWTRGAGCGVVVQVVAFRSAMLVESVANVVFWQIVVSLRDQLQKVQSDIDKDPHNHILRENEALHVKEFYESERDEEKFLFQQAKIKWLSDDDKK